MLLTSKPNTKSRGHNQDLHAQSFVRVRLGIHWHGWSVQLLVHTRVRDSRAKDVEYDSRLQLLYVVVQKNDHQALTFSCSREPALCF
jgi:hypothetical protein